VAAGDFIEVPAGRGHFDRPECFVPTGAGDPFAGLGFGNFFRNALAEFIQRFHAREIDTELGGAGVIDVQVRVVKAGHDKVGAEVDDLSL